MGGQQKAAGNSGEGGGEAADCHTGPDKGSQPSGQADRLPSGGHRGDAVRAGDVDKHQPTAG